MAKPKDLTKIPNRQAYSRISFLYQAANYFSTLPDRNVSDPVTASEGKKSQAKPTTNSELNSRISEKHGFPLSAYLGSHLMTIGRKGSLKIARSIKRSVCKRCKVILRPGTTSAVSLENKSSNGAKSHASVLLVTCRACGMEKRYAVGAEKAAPIDEVSEQTSDMNTT